MTTTLQTVAEPSIAGPSAPSSPPTRRRLLLPVTVAVVLLALLAIGLWPRLVQNRRLSAAGASADATHPRVTVAPVRPGPASIELQLPANIEAVSEVAIHARADGYVRRRYVDIGDRVRAGHVLAEIESPELAEQIRQAAATDERARAALRQTEAASEQSRVNRDLAEVTLRRWETLVGKGVLSKQDGDEKQTAYRAREADLAASEAAIAAAQQTLQAAEADHRRLRELQGFRQIRAPFDGIVTVRYTDVGALVTAGSGSSLTPLFRLAALDRLRAQIYVPQGEASAVLVGLPCTVEVRDLGGRAFNGRVTRTASALDPSSRTLLAEVAVENPDALLRPGMSATVRVALRRERPPLLIPATAFQTGEGGPRVAVVDAKGIVHFRSVRLGRDNGAQIEVLEGLKAGERVAISISDALREGAIVEAVVPRQPAAAPKGPGR